MVYLRRILRFLFLLGILSLVQNLPGFAQCPAILEPGFAFLTSSRGCAPFTVSIQTFYLASAPGTQYFVLWGDGTAEETFTQVGVNVTMTHLYPLASINCGYDVVIDASNACNPRGSVVPITTQVIVWTNDVVAIDPTVYRVCAGYAANVSFTDNSTWNCFPRLTRENNAPRWIQWIYGTGPLGTLIPGMKVNSVTPGAYPYNDPAPGRNPIYPVISPGQVSLPINVPVTVPADIGKDFEITLKNWNQCNPYDNNLVDGAFNPADLVNGDNPAQVTTARIVIVDAPQPTYVTRLGNAGGPVQSVFCISDLIYFDDNTPPIPGASFQYTWDFYDNNTGVGVPLNTSNNTNPTFAYVTPGQKLIRLSVKDQNAAGNCVSTFQMIITISPSLVAQIQMTDFANTPITGSFCQNAGAPFTGFQVRFNDVSVGVATPTTQWRWEFYDENGVLIQQVPLGGGFSAVALGPFDKTFTNRGTYTARLIIRDNITSCQTIDQVQVYVYEKPVALFVSGRVCQGQPNLFTESSTLNAIDGESIVLREWDFNFDGVTFNKDPAFDNQTLFSRPLGASNTYQVALRVTTDQNNCSAILVVPVRVDPLPTANFSPDLLSGCSVLKVTFTNNSILGQPDVIDHFTWEVDARGGLGFQPVGTQSPSDPAFSNQFVSNFKNTTAVNKLFDVRLRVVTVNNCETISAPITLTVFPGTTSGFISTNYSPFNNNCSPVSVNFSVDAQTQSLTPTSYRWVVSDLSGIVSDVSSGTTPAYSYNFVNTSTAINDFLITLTTTLTSGCFGDSTRTIRVSPIPVSLFQIDTIITDCQRMRFRFTAQQKGLQYHWVVAENAIMTLNSNSSADFIEYEVARGSININVAVSLDTKNIANCISNVTTQSVVVDQKNVIINNFIVTPLTQTLPSATVFITNTTNAGPWTYEWDFGDGTVSTSSAISLQHTYASYGKFVITLTVKNNFCLEVQTKTVTVNAALPVADFSYDPPSGCAPVTVNFTNLSTFAEPDGYNWKFGDGQAMSAAINPTYTYFEPGIYTVSLSASNIAGQVMTTTKDMIIEVFAKPSAQFETKPKLVYLPGGILYTKNNSFNASRYAWNFGDGGTSDEFEPQYSYQAVGAYTISLIAFSVNNCSDTTTVNNAVTTQNGGQILVPNAFSPNVSGASTGGTPGSGGSSDGKNDIFLPIMRGVTQFEMLVFNRWGELLFESSDAQSGWDGYYNGKLCAQDVYVYKITALYENGERIVRTGDINLIR